MKSVYPFKRLFMMRPLRIVLYVLPQVFLFACASMIAIYEGDRSHLQGHYDRAISYFYEALKSDPNNQEIYNKIGISYFRMGEDDKAIEFFTKALEIDPKYYPAYMNRGYVWKRKADYDHAIADFKKALTISQKISTDAYYAIGYSLAKKGDLDGAIKSFSVVIKIKPDASSYNNRGVCYYDQGEYDLAIDDFTKTIDLDKRYYSAYVYRGRAWTKKGLYDKAIEDNSTALKLLDSESENVRFPDWNPRATMLKDRGLNYYYLGKFDQAIADYEHAMRYAQDDAELLCYRGDAWMRTCAMDRAVHDYTWAIKLQPNSAHAYRSLAFIHASSPDVRYRDAKRAISLATKAVELENAPASQEALAAAYAEQGDFAAAVRAQEVAMSMMNGKTTATDRKEAQRRLQLYQTHTAFRLAVSCQKP